MDTSTEREIADGLRRGDCRAWRKLYEVYAESVWKNVSRLLNTDILTVDDIVQETFLAAARSAKDFDSKRGSLWVWLWAIARRQVALYYRKQKSNTKLNQAQQWWNTLDDAKFDWIDARADIPDDIVQSEELATLVRRSLYELPSDYQTLLLTKYVDNLSIDMIAKRMNCSESAVRSKLARARKAFRKVFRKAT